MDSFYSVPTNKIYTSEIEINKSRFLGFAKYADTVQSAQNFVQQIREKFRDARHVVYAYVVDGMQKSSDDGEPSGTAGRPMLGFLQNKNCEHIVVVVVRYFGGIKLGAGGLLRAYLSSAQKTVESNLALFLRGRKFKVGLEYNEYNQFLQKIKNKMIKITKTEFLNKIELEFVCFEDFDMPNSEFLGDVFDTMEAKDANNRIA